tara:strand:- start:9660 stop:10133 length:474 start_codon:yes stop_codon:yes gene_type:complete
MIDICLICKSNHWPPRMKKIDLLIKKILNFKNELFFKKNTNYICNLILTNDKLVKKMNNKFCNIKKSTDVLTFVSDLEIKNIKKKKICDIFLSAQLIKKDAKVNKISFYDHLAHLIIHSFLHINGFEHKKIKDFDKMKKIEILILKKIGINNPYLIT